MVDWLAASVPSLVEIALCVGEEFPDPASTLNTARSRPFRLRMASAGCRFCIKETEIVLNLQWLPQGDVKREYNLHKTILQGLAPMDRSPLKPVKFRSWHRSRPSEPRQTPSGSRSPRERRGGRMAADSDQTQIEHERLRSNPKRRSILKASPPGCRYSSTKSARSISDAALPRRAQTDCWRSWWHSMTLPFRAGVPVNGFAPSTASTT